VRVVLDTNVLLSACLKPAGLEAQVVEMAISGAVEACVTSAVLDEYADVLRRDKFRAYRDRAEAILAAIEACTVRVVPLESSTAALDEDDNRFLECAAAAGSEYLITGNLRHYPAQWGTAKIVNSRAFLDAITSPPGAPVRPDN
jgi:putative PIN family toxin of toxin-antitoxin system